jgi:oxidoreductase
MPSAAIFGATGAVGKHILASLLAAPEFTKVGEFGRRVTSVDALQGDKSKLLQKTVDFEKISEEPALKEHWDVVYISYVNLQSTVRTPL